MSQYKWLVRFMVLVGVLHLQSCAAMFTGTTSDVMFTSKPEGALVTVGEVSGTTPCSLEVPKKLIEATFTHPDHDGRGMDLQRSFQGGFLLMDILFTPGFGLSGILVDAGTSAWYKHAPLVHCDFTAPPPPPMDRPKKAVRPRGKGRYDD